MIVLIRFLFRCFFQEENAKYIHWNNCVFDFLPNNTQTTSVNNFIEKVPLIVVFMGLILIFLSYFSHFYLRFNIIIDSLSIIWFLKVQKPSYLGYQQIWVISCVNQNIQQGRSYLSCNIIANNCYFSRTLIYDGVGGIILVEEDGFSMTITLCVFYNCRCTSEGGAIVFGSSNSNIKNVCASLCFAQEYYHFGNFECANKNDIEFLTISKCSTSTLGNSVLLLSSGNQKITTSNFSLNQALTESALVVSLPTSFQSSHCTFSNNKVSGSTCIRLVKNTGSILFANFVHNNSPSQGNIYVFSNGKYSLNFCVFDFNTGTLFCVHTGELTVLNSFISHSGTLKSGTVTTSSNNSLIRRATYIHQHFMSRFCNAENPNIKPIATVSSTKMRTRSPTQVRTRSPTQVRTRSPTQVRTRSPTQIQTRSPTQIQTRSPTQIQTRSPTQIQTMSPTHIQTRSPTQVQTRSPTQVQTRSPTHIQTRSPTQIQTRSPSQIQTMSPTHIQTISQTHVQTMSPTHIQTISQTHVQTMSPTQAQTMSQTQVQTISQTHVQTIINTIKETPKISEQPPIFPTLEHTYSVTNMETTKIIYFHSTIINPVQTPLQSCFLTLKQSIIPSFQMTNEHTPHLSELYTPLVTFSPYIQRTEEKSPKISIMNTPNASPIYTKDVTSSPFTEPYHMSQYLTETTMYRTYDEKCFATGSFEKPSFIWILSIFAFVLFSSINN